ncbi:hypothetical protein C8R44DRAFT_65393 [Mycena epipterygia]|nr:hypothetical protein C8R44DRAFT_65393 [Mycena epipterygia]
MASKSSYASSKHEGPTIASERAARAADRVRLAVIKAQISDLESSLRSLRPERDLLQSRLDAYTYPVLTLPNEIVSEIFINFLPVYPKRRPVIGLLSPTLLCQICRKWRDIALSTPSLWRAVTVSFLERVPPEENLRLLEAFMNHSASCPLSIDFECGINSRKALGSGLLDEFIQAITSHRARWEHLKLHGPLGALRSIEGPLPFLRALTILVYFGEEYEVDSAVTLAFHQAPVLKKVDISGYDGFKEIYYTILPWSQLTVLTIWLISAHECGKILDAAVNLVYCRLTFCHKRNGSRSVNVLQTCLQSLILSHLPFEDQDPLWSFLDVLTLPALCNLQVAEALLPPDPVATLLSLVSRSSCNLQQLCITGARTPSDSYRNAFPSVRSLAFDGELDIDSEDGFFPDTDEDTDGVDDTDGDSDEESD